MFLAIVLYHSQSDEATNGDEEARDALPLVSAMLLVVDVAVAVVVLPIVCIVLSYYIMLNFYRKIIKKVGSEREIRFRLTVIDVVVVVVVVVVVL